MRILLFRNKNYQATSKMLRDLWELRKNILKQIETINPRVLKSTNQEDENNNINNHTLDNTLKKLIIKSTLK